MCVLKLCSRCEALHYWEKEAHGCQERGESQCNHTINFRWNNVITLMEKILQVFSKILSVFDLWCSSVQRKVSVLRRWAVRVSPRWKSKRRWPRSWERSRLPRPRNKRRSPCEEHKHTHPVETHCLKVGPTKLTVFFLQRGINAFGVQRTGDWQKDGGEEAEEPGGQEEGAGREAGHGLRQQEVMLQHKHVVETPVCVFPVWMCVCSLSQCRLPLCDVRDAGDWAGNSCGSQVLYSLQTGPVWRAGLHLRTSKVSLSPPCPQSLLVYRSLLRVFILRN